MTKDQVLEMAKAMIKGIENEAGRSAEYKAQAIEKVWEMVDQTVKGLEAHEIAEKVETVKEDKKVNKFAKHIEKAAEKGRRSTRIRKDVIRRIIEKGEFHRLACDYSYTDDYAWDAASNFGKGEVKDTSRIIDYLTGDVYCYVEVKDPNRIHIIVHSNLSYSLYLEAPAHEEKSDREPSGEHADSHECESTPKPVEVAEPVSVEASESKSESLEASKPVYEGKKNNVIDFTSRLAEKRKKEESKRLHEWFFKMFGDQPRHVLLEIAKSIEDRDQEKYDQLTIPILLKKSMIEANKGDF